MSNELTIARSVEIAEPRALDPAKLIERWKEGRSEKTLLAYAGDLAHFTRWLGDHQPGQPMLSEGNAIAMLFAMHPGEANETARSYRNSMVDARLAPATVNRRLAALRSIVAVGKQFGHIFWDLELADVRSQKYRDTRGPDPADIARVIEHVSKAENPARAARDVAIVMLMFANGLRVGEVVSLNTTSIDMRGMRLEIMGKGRRETEWITIDVTVGKVLKTWLGFRGRDPGPLFVGIDRHGRQKDRITDVGIRQNMAQWGDELELVLRPHGLRHSAVTAVLDATNGDIRAARKFARHGSVEVTLRYDDNREDLAGNASKLIAARMAAVIDGLVERGSSE